RTDPYAAGPRRRARRAQHRPGRGPPTGVRAGSERRPDRDQLHATHHREVEVAELQTETAVAGGRRTSPPFRANHVGSLLKPPELLKARDDFKAGNITAEQLRAVEDDAIRDVVKLQRDVGLQSATDDEFRRASWHMDFIY